MMLKARKRLSADNKVTLRGPRVVFLLEVGGGMAKARVERDGRRRSSRFYCRRTQ